MPKLPPVKTEETRASDAFAKAHFISPEEASYNRDLALKTKSK